MWILLTAIASASPVTVTAGTSHSCMARHDGTAWCWGGLESKALRAGQQPTHLTPAPVELTQVARIDAGGDLQTCAVKQDGTLWCWKVDHPPQQVGSLIVADVSVGESHACALTAAGRVWCWGYNSRGQLGDGTVLTRSNPVLVEGLDDVEQISAGWYHTCALRKTGEVSCWGGAVKVS